MSYNEARFEETSFRTDIHELRERLDNLENVEFENEPFDFYKRVPMFRACPDHLDRIVNVYLPVWTIYMGLMTVCVLVRTLQHLFF